MKKLSLLLISMLVASPVAYAYSPAEREMMNKDASEVVKEKMKQGGYVQESKSGAQVTQQADDQAKDAKDQKATKNKKSKKKSKKSRKKASK